MRSSSTPAEREAFHVVMTPLGVWVQWIPGGLARRWYLQWLCWWCNGNGCRGRLSSCQTSWQDRGLGSNPPFWWTRELWSTSGSWMFLSVLAQGLETRALHMKSETLGSRSAWRLCLAIRVMFGYVRVGGWFSFYHLRVRWQQWFFFSSGTKE